jgi:uncharacterized protein YuzE
MESTRVLRATFDPEADAAYVYLQPPDAIEPSVANTVIVSADINLDFDDSGRLIGVEILRGSALHPALLDEIQGRS